MTPTKTKQTWYTKTLVPYGRCNNCMTYYHKEDNTDKNGICPNCKTGEYLMDMPEIAMAVHNHEAFIEALENVHDIINSYSHIPAQRKACEIIQQALKRVESEE